MGTLRLEMSMSLDGFVAGPNPTLEAPLGEGGERLHDWAVATASFRARHGMEGGEHGVDDDVVAAGVGGVGATIMGRRCSAAAPGRGRTIRTRIAGSGRIRPSTIRCSSSRATRA